jgi:hypothetical protein
MPLGLSGNPPSPWARAGCKANPQQLPKVMILRSLLLILTLALVGASPGGVLGAPTSQDRPKCAQPWVSPVRLVERFYDRAGFPDRASFYTGEMLEHYSDAPTLGLLLPDDVRVQHRSVLVGCERAVYATTTSTPEHGEDWYLHMLWACDLTPRRPDCLFRQSYSRTSAAAQGEGCFGCGVLARLARGAGRVNLPKLPPPGVVPVADLHALREWALTEATRHPTGVKSQA